MKHQNITTVLTAFGIFILSIVIGMLGYSLIEHFNFVDAFYMTIITIGAVGFSEVHQLSEVGKIFTSFYIIFNLGVYAFVLFVITTHVFQGELGNLFNNLLNRKKMSKMENHIIVCGYGRNGLKATNELLKNNYQIVVIERNAALFKEKNAEKLPNLVFIEGDATQDELLTETGIQRASAILITLPNDSENVFITLTARELNSGIEIVARASDPNSEKKLKRAGADFVVMPEFIGGVHMARLVTNPEMMSFMNMGDEDNSSRLRLEEIMVDKLPKHYYHKSIAELHIDKKILIVGYRDEDENFTFNPEHSLKMNPKGIVFLLGTHDTMEVFRKKIYL